MTHVYVMEGLRHTSKVLLDVSSVFQPVAHALVSLEIQTLFY